MAFAAAMTLSLPFARNFFTVIDTEEDKSAILITSLSLSPPAKIAKMATGITFKAARRNSANGRRSPD